MKSNFCRVTAILLIFSSFFLTPISRASEEGDDLRAADSVLNDAYKETLDAMPTATAKSKLREAQRAWIAFRDAEIALKGELPGASGNTLKIYQTELTELRTKQLKTLRTDGAE